jgi:hypothetical protein
MPIPESLTCSACGSQDFGRLEHVSFEMWFSLSEARGATHRNAAADPIGDLAVCLGCGKSDLFVSDPAGFVADARPRGARQSPNREATS